MTIHLNLPLVSFSHPVAADSSVHVVVQDDFLPCVGNVTSDTCRQGPQSIKIMEVDLQ